MPREEESKQEPLHTTTNFRSESKVSEEKESNDTLRREVEQMVQTFELAIAKEEMQYVKRLHNLGTQGYNFKRFSSDPERRRGQLLVFSAIVQSNNLGMAVAFIADAANKYQNPANPDEKEEAKKDIIDTLSVLGEAREILIHRTALAQKVATLHKIKLIFENNKDPANSQQREALRNLYDNIYGEDFVNYINYGLTPNDHHSDYMVSLTGHSMSLMEIQSSIKTIDGHLDYKNTDCQALIERLQDAHFLTRENSLDLNVDKKDWSGVLIPGREYLDSFKSARDSLVLSIEDSEEDIKNGTVENTKYTPEVKAEIERMYDHVDECLKDPTKLLTFNSIKTLPYPLQIEISKAERAEDERAEAERAEAERKAKIDAEQRGIKHVNFATPSKSAFK